MADTFIITDGGVASLLMLAIETSGNQVDAASVWIPASLEGTRIAAVQRQAAYFGMPIASEQTSTGGPTPADDLRTLLEAGIACRQKGGGEIVWASNAPPAPSGDGPDVESIARIVEQSVLMSQIVTLSSGAAAISVRFRVPLADLTDRQLADLVLDLDLPIWLCWWWDQQSTEAAAERDRWMGLLKQAGWVGEIRPEVVTRPARNKSKPGEAL